MKRVILGLVTVCLGACSQPAKKIYTQIEIDAPPEKVWEALADNRNYGAWNPYHVRVEGQLREGEQIEVDIQKPNNETVQLKPKVITVSRPHKLVWGGGVNYIFRGEHVFELVPVADEKTRLIHREKFEGLAVPFASLDAIEEGYNLMNLALKEHVEGRADRRNMERSALRGDE